MQLFKRKQILSYNIQLVREETNTRKIGWNEYDKSIAGNIRSENNRREIGCDNLL